MAKRRLVGRILTVQTYNRYIGDAIRWRWRMAIPELPSLSIQGETRPKRRSTAIRHARKAAEYLNIDIRSVDGEAV